MPKELPAKIEDRLKQIEEDLRKLGIEYDQFFAGGRRRPPRDTQWRVDDAFRQLTEMQLTLVQQFRLNQLQQRYAGQQQIWRRKLEIKESGIRRRADRWLGIGNAPAPNPAQDQPVAFEFGHAPEIDDANVERLYGAFLRLRERSTSAPPAGTLDSFRSFITQKMRQMGIQPGQQTLEAKVSLDDGRLSLRFRTRRT